MKKYGMIVAGIGIGILLWALIAISMATFSFSGCPTPDKNASFLSRNFYLIFYVVKSSQLIIGSMLLAGGLAFRAYKEWGRKMIVFVLGTAIAYLIGSFIFSLISIAEISTHTIIIVIGELIIFSIFFIVFWKVLKYFKSEFVKNICIQP